VAYCPWVDSRLADTTQDGGLKRMTNYRLRQLGHRLKVGEAEVTGIVSLGHEWPSEPQAWIIYDYTDTGVRVEHVDIRTRPSWSRYYHAPTCASGATATGYVYNKPIW